MDSAMFGLTQTSSSAQTPYNNGQARRWRGVDLSLVFGVFLQPWDLDTSQLTMICSVKQSILESNETIVSAKAWQKLGHAT